MTTTAIPDIDLRVAVAVGTLEAAPTSAADRAERWGTLLLPFGLFCWVGWRLAVGFGDLPGDALSRVGNASAAVLSRDPHLESIGFVWSPFPTLWQVPLLNYARIWPVLVDRGVVAVVVSAFFMAWMVSAVRRWLVDIGVQRWVRLVLIVTLVLHPFVLLYGANGMSEAGMLCFSVLAARRVALWFETERPLELARAGVVLGFGYLTRYEVAATMVGLVALVALVSYQRARGEQRHRVREVALRCAVIGFPAFFSVFLWMLVSWAIVDEPFAQFSSKYGNSQLVKAGAAGIISAAGAINGLPRVLFFMKQVLAFGAIAGFALALIVWWGTRKGPRIWTAVVALGAPIGFQLITAYAGSSFAWGRYVIAIVPLTTLLLGAVAVNLSSISGHHHRLAGLLVCSLAAASSLMGLVVVRSGQFETRDERAELAALPSPYGTAGVPNRGTAVFVGDRIAADIDGLHPRRGEVLTDTSTSFAVVINAEDQRDYVITSDRDFERINADPGIFGVRYLLVPDPQFAGNFNALNAEHPMLFENGGGIATLVKEWRGGPQTPRFRLYELNPEQRIGRD
jgi:hypothetical protein